MSIFIRAATPADAADLIRLRNMPAVRRGTLAIPYESVRERGGQLVAALAAPENMFLVACDGDELTGCASLHRARAAGRAHTASLGIMVADCWHGKGVGTALFAALTDLADNWLNLHRLELCVFTDNPAAIALYRKFGFEIEGTERADAMCNGIMVDSYIMARLRSGLAPDISLPPPPAVPAPQMPVTLRAAEAADLPGITELMNQPHVRRGTLHPPFSTHAQNRSLAEPPDGQKIILAMAGDLACGIAGLVPGKGRRAHTADLTLLAVHDAWVRRGIGASLLRATLDVAKNWLGLRRITLSVLADNAPAIALYQAHGFAVEGCKRADVFRAGGYADALRMASLH
jgi:putative acetyltransferase